MKIPKHLILIPAVFLVAGAVLFKPLAISLIKRQLKSALQADSVSLRDFSITPAGRLVFSGIEIKQKSNYNIEISELKVNYNPFKRQLEYLDLKLAFLEYRGLRLNGGVLTVSRGITGGNFYLREFAFDKLKIKEIRSPVELEGESISFGSIFGKILGGRLQGQSALRLSQVPQYRLDLQFIELDLSRFIADFNLQERFQLTGRASGSVALEGTPQRVSFLGGDFQVLSPGGRLLIKDPAVLENLSRMAGQSLKVLVEGFQDYQYNIGTMDFSLDNNDLVWKIGLNGEGGKRDLTVVWHDFQSKEERQ